MLRLFNVLANFPFTTSGMMSDYYYGQVAVADEKQNLRKLKYTSKLSKPHRMIAQGSFDNTRRKPNTNSTLPTARRPTRKPEPASHTPCESLPPETPSRPWLAPDSFKLNFFDALKIHIAQFDRDKILSRVTEYRVSTTRNEMSIKISGRFEMQPKWNLMWIEPVFTPVWNLNPVWVHVASIMWTS